MISRKLALSYFDHPPLHQWIVHGFVVIFGESHAARLPFVAINIATSIALYGLTRRLFDARAALFAVLAFNASGYFLTLPDGYIMPDAPLLLCLATGVWAIAEILYGPPGREGRLWLLAGLCLGLAGLAKYSAIFAPLGLLGFLISSPQHRRWLGDPRSYLAGALSLAIVSPALIWNAEHHWVSFAFQTNRAATGFRLDGRALAAIFEGLGAQLASLTPWVALPVLCGLWRARRGDADSGRRLLLWLAGPPVVYFALIPLLGQRAIPHWFNSGWLFAFPLAGAWIAERSKAFAGNWARASAALSLVVVGLYLAALGGLISFLGSRDPTRYAHDFPVAQVQKAYEAAGAKFAIVDNWRLGGRLGVALGPDISICAFGSDPRGLAFACSTQNFVGATALAASENGSTSAPEFTSNFDSVEPAGALQVGPTRRTYVFRRANNLHRAFPLPYGP